MRIYKRKGTANWQLEIHHRGRLVVRESTGTDDRKLATAYGKKREAEIVLGKAPRSEDTLTYEELEALLLEHYAANEYRSVKSLRGRLAHLRDFFGGWKAREITSDAVATYKAERLKAGTAKGSIDNEIMSLSAMFRLATERELVSRRPVIKCYRVDHIRQGFVSKAEFYAIHRELPAWLKDYAEWLFLTANRTEEVRTLERRDIDLQLGLVHIRREHAKNKESRELPLMGPLRAIAERGLSDARPDCPFLFRRNGRQLTKGQIRHAWLMATARAGLGHILMHDLRRSAIRNMRDLQVDEQTAQEFSGHKTVTTFRRYRILSRENKAASMSKYLGGLEEQPSASVVVPLRKGKG